MIKTIQFAEYLETQLNTLIGQSIFKIRPNIANFTDYLREEDSNKINQYINGIVNLGDANLLSIRGLQAYTQSVQLEIIVDVEKQDKQNNDEFPEVTTIETLLYKFIANNNAIPITFTDSDGVNFEITPSYSGVRVGDAQILSPIGLCVPISMFGTLTIIESGINTNNVKWYINNVPIMVQSYSATRKRELESDIPLGENFNKSLPQSNGLSLTLIKPMLTDEISQLIEQDLYSGIANRCFLITRIRALLENNYYMIIAQNSESGEIGANIGSTINLVEGRKNLMNYDNFKIHEQVTMLNDSKVLVVTTPILSGKKYKIWLYWGQERIKEFDHIMTGTTTYGDITLYVDNSGITFDLTNTTANVDDLVLGGIELEV